MITLWLKHKIIDKCISMILDRVISSFATFEVSYLNANVGDFITVGLDVDSKMIKLNKCEVISKTQNIIIVKCTDTEPPFSLVISMSDGALIDIVGANLAETFSYLKL